MVCCVLVLLCAVGALGGETDPIKFYGIRPGYFYSEHLKAYFQVVTGSDFKVSDGDKVCVTRRGQHDCVGEVTFKSFGQETNSNENNADLPDGIDQSKPLYFVEFQLGKVYQKVGGWKLIQLEYRSGDKDATMGQSNSFVLRVFPG